MYSIWLLVLTSPFLNVAEALPYDVHWLSGATTIEREITKTEKPVDIYCYAGTTKNILSLWQTVKFHIKIKNDEFQQYFGYTPEETYKVYQEDSYGWSVNPFQRKNQRTVTMNVFNITCMAVNTKQRHTIDLQVIRVDLWRVLLMVFGAALILSSRTLSGNPVFFYLCGILLGVSASFMVLVYYISKLLPRKTLTYGMLIGGWTIGVYVFQQLWENIRSIVLSYQTYLFWYTTIMGFLSFVICYRIGPPKNERSKDIVMWTLQVVGVLMIFFSSDYQEAAIGVILVTLIVKYFPQSLLILLLGYWRRRFPPKLKLLSSEEYYEQGARETKMALENLRKHCSSPDCAQWRIMLKLNDSKRFASFVEGDSHLSDSEIMDYETYAFSMESIRKPTNSAVSFNTTQQISDDDESLTDDEIEILN